MSYYIVIRGPLGCGKSTISEELAKRLNAKHISMDKVLEEHNLDEVDEKLGFISTRNFIKANEIVLPKVKRDLNRGKIIIFDGCFYHKEQIEHLEKNLQGEHFVFALKASLKECIKRDSKRKRVYGKDAALIVYGLVTKFDYGKIIDTNGKTPYETTQEILDYMRSVKKKYKFRPYDSVYPELYNKEKLRIIKSLGKNIEIEHVGSTAVPDLGGKGIIDIAIKSSKAKIKRYLKGLEKLGFQYSQNHPGNDKRIFMQKIVNEKGKERRTHIHLCLTKEFWDSFILFRDYLRENRSIMKEYARIKKEGAKIAKGDGKKYANHKEDFLKEIVRKAVEEVYPSNKAHFLKLIEFAKEIIKICKQTGINPVIYGSFAHFYWTKDKGMKVNDIDMWIPERSYGKLIKEFNRRGIEYKYHPEWHTMSVKNEDLTLEIDSIDFWYRDLDGQKLKSDFKNIDFYGEKVRILGLKGLEELYLIAYGRTKDDKVKIAKKIERLERFLGRRLK